MRELSIGEIADTMGVTKRAAEMRATRAGWRYRIGAGTGRPRVYAITDLPEDVRIACASAQLSAVDVPLAVARAAEAEPEAERLSSAAAEARDARLAIMEALDSFTRDSGLSRGEADRMFCAAYEAGQIEVASWVRDHVRDLSPRTFRRWRAARKAGETHRLGVDKGAARRGRGALDLANDGDVRAVILAHMAQNPFLSADHIMTVVKDRFGTVLDIGGSTVPVPGVRTFQIALKAWRQTYAAELMALTNPDAFKDRLRVSGRTAHLVSRCNELWAIDASPADVLTKDGRYSIYVAIDVFSRRLLVHVTRTPRAAAVCTLMRRAIIAWGVPERVKTDNGSDFVAKATQRVMAGLGIEVELSAPFSPWQKGTIERAIGTVQRDLMRTLPGFIGHSVSDRKAIEGRRAFAQRLGCDPDKAFVVDLTPDELQDYANRWAEDRYAHRPHDGLTGQTPFAVASADRTPIRRPDIRALDMLLAPVAGSNGIRVVGKEGVQIDYTKYVVAAVPVGTEVLVRMDPADMGRAFLFDPAGEAYLGEAIAPELAGIDPAEVVRRAQAEQKALIAERTKELRKIKVKPRDVADAIRRQSAGHAATLLTFPKREEAYSTPALDAAAEAAAPAAPPAPVPVEIRELQQRLIAEENVTPIRREENAHDRWKRAQAIGERMSTGQPVAPADVLWLGGYREGSEFKGFALTYGDPLEKENPAEAGI